MSIDIFSQVKPENVKWFNFKTVGDAVQGTYIGVSQAVDSYGNNQFVYKLLDADGSTWNVGIKESNKRCVEQMAAARFGQIVGIKFAESIPPKDGKGNAFKRLEIYADPTLVDEAWVKKQAAEVESLKRLDAIQGAGSLAAEIAAVTAPEAPAASSTHKGDEPF
jgi:hypothetical protein